MSLIAIYHYKIIFRTLINCAIYIDLQISTDNKEIFHHIHMTMFFCRFPLFESGYGYLCYITVCVIILE